MAVKGLIFCRHFFVLLRFLYNPEQEYHTLEEISEALLRNDVQGALIDSYAGGTRRDLFDKPHLEVSKILDYNTAYGVVLGGDSVRLSHCFHSYMREERGSIFKRITNNVRPMQVSEALLVVFTKVT